MSAPKPYTDILEDMKNFVYKEPVLGKYKQKTAYINQSANCSSRPRYLLVTPQDPYLRSPYGISKPFDETKEEKDRKTLDLSIESPALENVLRQLDAQNIKVAVANANTAAWGLNKINMPPASLEPVISSMYKPLVKPSTKGYQPTVRLKLTVNDKENCTRFFAMETDEAGNQKLVPKDHTIIQQGCRVVPIVELASLWIGSNTFGMTLNATDVLVFSGPNREQNPFEMFGGSAPVQNNSDDAPMADAASSSSAAASAAAPSSSSVSSSSSSAASSSSSTSTGAAADNSVYDSFNQAVSDFEADTAAAAGAESDVPDSQMTEA